jgi:hypothetical protein
MLDFGGKTCWKTSTWRPRKRGQCGIKRGLWATNIWGRNVNKIGWWYLQNLGCNFNGVLDFRVLAWECWIFGFCRESVGSSGSVVKLLIQMSGFVSRFPTFPLTASCTTITSLLRTWAALDSVMPNKPSCLLSPDPMHDWETWNCCLYAQEGSRTPCCP